MATFRARKGQGASVFDWANAAEIDLTREVVSSDRRLVWVPVKRLDRRALAAVDHALLLPAARHCATRLVGASARDRTSERLQQELAGVPGVWVVVLGVVDENRRARTR